MSSAGLWPSDRRGPSVALFANDTSQAEPHLSAPRRRQSPGCLSAARAARFTLPKIRAGAIIDHNHRESGKVDRRVARRPKRLSVTVASGIMLAGTASFGE